MADKNKKFQKLKQDTLMDLEVYKILTMSQKTKKSPMEKSEASTIRTRSQRRGVSVCRITRAATISTPKTSKSTKRHADVKEMTTKLHHVRILMPLEGTTKSTKYKESDTMKLTQAGSNKTNKEQTKPDNSSDNHHNPTSTLTVRTSCPRVAATSSKTLSNVNKIKKRHVAPDISPLLPLKKSKKTSIKKQVETMSVSKAKHQWLETCKTGNLNEMDTAATAYKKPEQNKMNEMIHDLRIFLNNVGFLLGMVMLILSLTVISQQCSC